MQDNGESPALKNLSFNGNPIVGSKIGSGGDLCWGRSDSFGYRADVTALVAGNGSYAITGVASGGSVLAEGASLVAVYENPALPVRTVVIYDGFAVVRPGQTATATTTLS